MPSERATGVADDRKTSDEPFLQRWARLKSESAPDIPDIAGPGNESAPPDNPPPAPARSGDDDETQEVDLAALPEIDSLDLTSDFSVFMQDGIPEALRTRALQRLWHLDPSFNHIDGLLEYGEDYSGTGLAAEAVKTVYKIGRGMVSDESDEPAADAAVTGTGEADDNDVAADEAPVADTTGDDRENPDKAG